MVNQIIDRVLDALKDGKWHTQKDIINTTQIAESKIRLIISFIQQYQFVQVDRKRRIKLTSLAMKLIENTDATPSCEKTAI